MGRGLPVTPAERYEHPLVDDLLVSFQRYPDPRPAALHALPRSHGALPLLPVGPGRLLVPVPDGEAAWLGLVRPPQGRTWRLSVVATLTDGHRRSALPGPSGESAALLHVPPSHALQGVARDDGGWLPMAPARGAAVGVRLLDLSAWPDPDDGRAPASLRVELVDEARYAAAGGGAVPPPPPGATYGGWRLP